MLPRACYHVGLKAVRPLLLKEHPAQVPAQTKNKSQESGHETMSTTIKA